MKQLLLAIFLIVFGCKLIGVQSIFYTSTGLRISMDSQPALPSEELELQMELDEQQKSMLGEDEVYFFVPGTHFPGFLILPSHKPNLPYSRPFQGFTTQLFTPPNSI